jgi:hypothetical protein
MPNYDEPRDEIKEAIFRLDRKGQVVDSGRRRWSERTGRYEIVCGWPNAGCNDDVLADGTRRGAWAFAGALFE